MLTVSIHVHIQDRLVDVQGSLGSDNFPLVHTLPVEQGSSLMMCEMMEGRREGEEDEKSLR